MRSPPLPSVLPSIWQWNNGFVRAKFKIPPSCCYIRRVGGLECLTIMRGDDSYQMHLTTTGKMRSVTRKEAAALLRAWRREE